MTNNPAPGKRHHADITAQTGAGWDTVELMVGGLPDPLGHPDRPAEIAGRNLFRGIDGRGRRDRLVHGHLGAVSSRRPSPPRRTCTSASTSSSAGLARGGADARYIRQPDVRRVAAYLTYSGMVLHDSWIFGETTMTMLRLPLWVPQLIMPIGGFLLTVRLVQRVVHLLKTPASALVSEAVHSPTA